EVAQRIAFRLKGAGATGDHAASGPAGVPGQAGSASGGASQRSEGAPGAGRSGGGQGDFQQIVNRMPAATLADFKKDEAAMIVATEGTTPRQAPAIPVLGGVDPILAAAPAGSQTVTLSPWSLGGAPAMAGDAP